jgi:hypothetical protein
MTGTIGRITAVVAIVIVATGCGPSTGQGPGATPAPPTATPRPSATPAATAVASATPAPPLGEAPGLAWSYSGTYPAGWEAVDGGFGRSDSAYIEVLADRSVMAADCELRPEAGVGSSASDIVGALAARDGLGTSNLATVTVGGLSGQQIDLAIAPGWTGSCPWWDDPAKPVVPLVGTFDDQHYWLYNAVTSGEQFRYLVLDVPDGRNVLVAVVAAEPDRLQAILEPAMEIVSHLEFAVTP